MKLFKSLFLYFLSFIGFFCYGDSFSNGVVTAQWGKVNPSYYPNGNSMYYIVPVQQWNELPDGIKMDVFHIDPEQMRAFLNTQGLKESDMIGHYIGSMGHVGADIMSGKVKMLDEIYTGMGMENHVFHRETYNGGIVRAFIAGSRMEDATQTQWGGRQNWGMNIKTMGRRESKKIRAFGALPFKRGVVDSVSTGSILAKAIGLEDIEIDVSYMAAAKATMEVMQGVAGKMIFMKNNTDYIKAKMEEKGLGIDMTAPYQNLEFYVAEPIGGGGGAAILASMGVDTQEDYFELAEKIRATGMSHWHEALEKGQIQMSDVPAMWYVAPSNEVFNNPAFLEIWSNYFNK